MRAAEDVDWSRRIGDGDLVGDLRDLGVEGDVVALDLGVLELRVEIGRVAEGGGWVYIWD